MTTRIEKRELPTDAFGHERRVVTLDIDAVERRADDAGDGTGVESIGFKGHAAVFNKRTLIGSKKWGFYEQVATGAFAKTLKEADVRFLHNHDPNLVLARTAEAQTLRLAEDKTGLAVDADMAPTSYALDLAILLDRRDVSQMSFGFRTIADKWETIDDQGTELRTLLEVQLFDVSTVTFPAYAETDASLRAVALDVLCARMGIADNDRARLLSGLQDDDVSPEISPLLRAASQALADLADRYEPAETTRDETDVAGHLALRRRQLELMARPTPQ